MTPTLKFPLWIYLVLGVQVLFTLAGIAFVLMLGSAFSGELSLTPFQIAVLAAPLLVIAFCVWLSRQLWQTGQYNAAKALAFAPLAVFVGLFLGLELLMA